MLLGRESELRALTERIDSARDQGSALVVRGEAGIGKSSLLTAAKAHAVERGYRILTTAGVQSETHLPFAGLHQLLRPVLSEVDALPQAQRNAMLRAAREAGRWHRSNDVMTLSHPSGREREYDAGRVVGQRRTEATLRSASTICVVERLSADHARVKKNLNAARCGPVSLCTIALSLLIGTSRMYRSGKPLRRHVL